MFILLHAFGGDMPMDKACAVQRAQPLNNRGKKFQNLLLIERHHAAQRHGVFSLSRQNFIQILGGFIAGKDTCCAMSKNTWKSIMR